ncbi:hypothetical protein G7Y89_g7911 [Cudoniella acicularis]|uniref:Delta(24)-sterol reductase n=1 Tax=Cudoniella acicularis TaxID=354080 RepID=A0A8H4RJL6_9HELO|nr:hypothetical protein G7Y89_g7911 [Cudoniella acicularis]
MKQLCIGFAACRPRWSLHLLRVVSKEGGWIEASRSAKFSSYASLKRRSSVTSRLTSTPPFPSARAFSTSPPLRDDALAAHTQAVAKIASDVRSYYTRGQKWRIFHGSTNSTRDLKTKGKTNFVDTSSLNRVLSIHGEGKGMKCLVEPNVPMDRLVEATLKEGLVPKVVMEFPGITVGGGYSGTSGESSSFRHGFFDRTVEKVEMVMGDGEVCTLSENKKGDLFRGAAGAVGTFGVTTAVELQLQKARRFVKTTYWPVKGMGEAVEMLKEATREAEVDYVDGIMFSPTSGAIITGRLTDELNEGINVQRFSGAWDPWFYLHVQDSIASSPNNTPKTEAIPLAEYLFRYDRGGFWVGASAFKYFNFPFNRFTRWFLDDFLHTRMMYTALHASGQSKKYIVQDLALPYSTAEKFVEYTDKEFGIYPLWLCPLKQSPSPTMHPHSAETNPDGSLKDMLNIGLWGDGPSNHDEFVNKNRGLENKLRELGGMKWLYAHTYYSEDEFWAQFDREWYEGLRKKYKVETLPSVYEKVRVDVEAEKRDVESAGGGWWKRRWPWAGFYGIKKAIESRSYVEARRSVWKEFGREGK